jgi:hypothetical protein
METAIPSWVAVLSITTFWTILREFTPIRQLPPRQMGWYCRSRQV